MASCVAPSAMVVDPVDPAFGPAIAEIPRAANGAYAALERIAVSPQGKVAALALQFENEGIGCYTATLSVFLPDGQADASFGTGGRANAQAMGLPQCLLPVGSGVAAADDGGWYVMARPPDQFPQLVVPRVWKIASDGQGNPAFGIAGSAALPRVLTLARPTLQALPSGRIAIGGTFTLASSAGPYSALGVVMLLADGRADPTYGDQGIALAVPPNRPIYEGEGGGMAIAADGSALVAGNIFEDDAGARLYFDATVARFDVHGRLDRSYGVDGFAIPLPDASTYVQSLAVVNGEAFVAGIQNRDVPLAFVVRLKANGQLDLGFGDAGVAGNDDFLYSNWQPQIAVDAARRTYVTLMDVLGRVRITRLAADGRPDLNFGLDGSAYVVPGDWEMGSRAAHLVIATDGRPYLGLDGFSTIDPDRRAIGVVRIGETGGHREGIAAGTAIVYYHQQLDHFFLTANAAEQAKLDAGITAGWARTSGRFRVVTAGALPELSPVCRFYGRPEAGLDSHFFSAAPDECAAVLQKFSASWLLESSSVFQVHLPDRVTGTCPRGSQRILRAFNQRADANHFYGIFAFAPAGWTYEGYGPGSHPTTFCAPLL